MEDKIIAVIQALNQIEVKGKVNAAYLVAAINTLESIIKSKSVCEKEEERRDK